MARMKGVIITLLIILFLVVPLNLVHAQAATVQISPSTTTVGVGGNFTVNLTVTGVTNLAVWEFRVFYPNSILNCTNASEGPFLQEGGSSQYFTFNITNSYNATYGCVLLGSTLVGAVPGVSGSGVLANVTFQAIGSGNAILHFDNDPIWNFLLDATPPPRNPIPYTTADGAVQVSAPADAVAVTAVTPYQTVIGQGFTSNITITIANQGGNIETFNVTTYANATVIATIASITLPIGNSLTQNIVWNTTGFAKGNYTITVEVSLAPGETNTANNSYTPPWVIIAIQCDITGITGWPDGRVDMKDLAIVARCFGSTPGASNWNPNADFNCDGTVNMRDIALVARRFGNIDP